MRKALGLSYAVVGFTLTHLIFAGVILFLLDLIPYPSVDRAGGAALPLAIAADIGLIAVFGLQHSGMARAAIKRWVTRFLPEALERATYVHVANLALALLILGWQAAPMTLWSVEALWAKAPIWALFAIGWAISFAGSMMIDHLRLLGLTQAWAWFRGRALTEKPFQRHWLYERVRHPIQVGLILAFWAAPHMTLGHALFAGGLTLYILIGTRMEERDLVAQFPDYGDYMKRVGAFLPRLRR